MARQRETPDTDSLSDTLRALTVTLKDFTKAIASPRPLQTATSPAIPTARPAPSGGGSSALGNAAMFGAALGVATAALHSFINAAKSYVAAFNPGAIEAMDTAFRNLQATIGYAFEPVIQAITQAFRLLGGEIFDVFTQLRPIVSELAETFLNIAAPAIHAFGTYLRALVGGIETIMPVLRLFGTVLEGILTLGATLYELIIVLDPVKAILETLLTSLGGFDGIIKSVQSAFVNLTVGIIQVSDSLLRLFGASKVADAMLKNFARSVAAGGRAAAPRDFQIGGLEDVYRKRLVAAAQAQTGPNLTKSESLLDRIRIAVEEMARKQGLKLEERPSRPLGNRWENRNEPDFNRPGFEGGSTGGTW